MVTIKALRNYTDKELDRDIAKGEEYEVSEERATLIIRKGYADLILAIEKKDDEDELQNKAMAAEKKKNTHKR